MSITVLIVKIIQHGITWHKERVTHDVTCIKLRDANNMTDITWHITRHRFLLPVSVWQHWPPPWWSKDKRSDPGQLGIVIHQMHSPAYGEAPVEHWDRTYVTSPKGESNDTDVSFQNKKTVKKISLWLSRAGKWHSKTPWLSRFPMTRTNPGEATLKS